MQLSSRSSGCWLAFILSAMDGLTQSYIFKHRLQNCEPIDLSRFIVDLREWHLEFWTPYPTHPREHDCITNGVLFLQEGLWSLIRLISFLNTCFSTCLVMSSVVQLVSDFVSTPYVLRQWHGIKVIPPPVTCVILIVQDEQLVLFHCTNPHMPSVSALHCSVVQSAVWQGLHPYVLEASKA